MDLRRVSGPSEAYLTARAGRAHQTTAASHCSPYKTDKLEIVCYLDALFRLSNADH